MCKKCNKRSVHRGRLSSLSAAIYLAAAVPIGGAPSSDDVASPRPVLELPSLISAAQASEAKPIDDTGDTKWTCPMHPHYIAEEFGACPICGMDLVKLQTGDAGSGPVAGEQRTIVTISPEVMQNIGVRLGKVENVQFGRKIRSYGLVEENERAVSEVTAPSKPWTGRR
jgi:hypothetical protein